MQTTFIGGGVMAEAILGQALRQGVLQSAEVCVAEPIAPRREFLSDTYGVRATDDNVAAVEGAGLVVLACKPQQFASVAGGLRGQLRGGQTVLSILAGLTVKTIADGLKHDAVIRVMPNTPAQVGAGASVWMATEDVPAEARDAARSLLGVLGLEWFVADEHYLDMATAVSGSGPAYVFAFMESLIEAGVYMGMPRDMASALAVQTVLGAATLAKETGESPSVLRERVTSPGGTTAEALRVLEQHGFRSTVIEAAVAALHKAEELGGKS